MPIKWKDLRFMACTPPSIGWMTADENCHLGGGVKDWMFRLVNEADPFRATGSWTFHDVVRPENQFPI